MCLPVFWWVTLLPACIEKEEEKSGRGLTGKFIRPTGEGPSSHIYYSIPTYAALVRRCLSGFQGSLQKSSLSLWTVHPAGEGYVDSMKAL